MEANIGLNGKVAFDLKGIKEAAMWMHRGKAFQGKGTDSVKALSRD